MTGQELLDMAARLKTNPYYLAYALATGAYSIKQAFERDGGNHEFAVWNNHLWIAQAKAENVTREFVSIAPGACDRHCELCAALIPPGVTLDAIIQAHPQDSTR